MVYRVLGEYVLVNVRGVLIVGFVLEKYFGFELSSFKLIIIIKVIIEVVWIIEVFEGLVIDEEVGLIIEVLVKEKWVLCY